MSDSNKETKVHGQSLALTRRRLLHGSAALAGGAAGAGLIGDAAASKGPIRRPAPFSINRQEPAELVFTYWGSPEEQDAVANMTESFNEEHPNINVQPQYVALDGYEEKMTTMLAGGNPPDIAYMGSPMAFQWAVDGQTLDLKPYVDADPETAAQLPGTIYTYEGGKVLSTSLAISISLCYYNKSLFEEAGVEPPPTTGEAAWSWDQYVDIAKQLTTDREGRNAHDAEFDAENINTYGTTVPYWLPMLWSNGARQASEDGTQFLMNTPEAVDVLQKLQDLIYVHHVAPTPSASESLPATDVLMQTRKLAMDMNGMYKTLDYSRTEGLEWGMGVLPKVMEPMTEHGGVAMIISAACEHPDEAYEFYRWRYSPERIDLYEIGLWMPPVESYYTDEAKIKQWLDPEKGVYPPEARDILIDYHLNYTPNQNPGYWLKNQQQLNVEVITPAFTALLANEGTAQELFDQAASDAAPLMQGRW